ncbi:hypothetical protein FR483_n371L [Paramecium bursaria Chlorella virus FR483]|uniref:Uncharacterized protein n371L n=1 Tax=Paramecium bursaria Chlorella virus FR483 TaxID=399781 RepID=A7J775_PBCVF|nr:hypothetical protein FR483_n371L [Paramecium bursaria Chlorella virus FR483]ABT15656.1 hypothetical protein FR483_n371L [Paramecium bursaria Chlorella virus FR483]
MFLYLTTCVPLTPLPILERWTSSPAGGPVPVSPPRARELDLNTRHLVCSPRSCASPRSVSPSICSWKILTH